MKLQLLPALSAVVLLAACGGKSEDAATAPEAVATETAATTEAAAPVAPEAVPVAFDLSQVAISTATLGEFPYIVPPAGYEIREEKTVDLGAYPVWTGGGFLTVEGKLYMARSKMAEGKTYSRVEFERGIETAVTAAGGIRVARSEVPNDVLSTLPEDLMTDTRLGMGAIFGNPFASYVIRRADRTIWIQTVTDTGSANWAIIDAPAAAPTNTAP